MGRAPPGTRKSLGAKSAGAVAVVKADPLPFVARSVDAVVLVAADPVVPANVKGERKSVAAGATAGATAVPGGVSAPRNQ